MWRVRSRDDGPKTEVAKVPSRVGVPSEVSKTPHLLSSKWKLSYAEDIDEGVWVCNWESSRFAQSITIKILRLLVLIR